MPWLIGDWLSARGQLTPCFWVCGLVRQNTVVEKAQNAHLVVARQAEQQERGRPRYLSKTAPPNPSYLLLPIQN